LSVIIEIYYRSREDPSREARIFNEAAKFGGILNFKEQGTGDASDAICLTFEFSDHRSADRGAAAIRSLGEHVEGPADYE
jgi:hypothetical protein